MATRHLPATLACLIIAAFGQLAFATPADPAKEATPGRGMSMADVERGFGQPSEVRGPIGTPPITRWVYEGFTVYFDQSYVIHSVRHDEVAGGPSPSAR
jgi:hypothetical protein